MRVTDSTHTRTPSPGSVPMVSPAVPMKQASGFASYCGSCGTGLPRDALLLPGLWRPGGGRCGNAGYAAVLPALQRTNGTGRRYLRHLRMAGLRAATGRTTLGRKAWRLGRVHARPSTLDTPLVGRLSWQSGMQ